MVKLDAVFWKNWQNFHPVWNGNNCIIENAQDSWKKQLENIFTATLITMITRYKTDSEVEYQSRCRVEQWEVPMIEVVLVNTKKWTYQKENI